MFLPQYVIKPYIVGKHVQPKSATYCIFYIDVASHKALDFEIMWNLWILTV